MTLPGDIDGQRFLRALLRLGCRVERQRGSHRTMRGPNGRKFVVAFHARIRRGSIRRALRDASIDEARFLAAL